MKKAAVAVVINHFGLSERKACKIAEINRCSYRYTSKKPDDSDIRSVIKKIAGENKRYGAPRIHIMLLRSGFTINHKKTERIYKEEGLSLRRKNRKHLKSELRMPLTKTNSLNDIWAIDFVSDSYKNGKRVRILNVIDESNREALSIYADTSIPAYKLTMILDRIAYERGYPKNIRCDNGPEFRSIIFDKWAIENNINISFINPGKPMENGFIESFNGKFRDECLSMNYFLSLEGMREILEKWRIEYNTLRPHRALGGFTPAEIGVKMKQ
jgi:putative transposase